LSKPRYDYKMKGLSLKMTQDYKLPRNMSKAIPRGQSSEELIDTRYKKKWLDELEQKEITRNTTSFPDILKSPAAASSYKTYGKSQEKDLIEEEFSIEQELEDFRDRKLTALRVHNKADTGNLK